MATGLRFVHQNIPTGEKCRLCQKIDTKKRRRLEEIARVKRWQMEAGRKASIEKAMGTIKELEEAINDLELERQTRYRERC